MYESLKLLNFSKPCSLLLFIIITIDYPSLVYNNENYEFWFWYVKMFRKNIHGMNYSRIGEFIFEKKNRSLYLHRTLIM